MPYTDRSRPADGMGKECCPTGNGGNSTITNQDEQMILDRTTQGCHTRTEGAQDGEFH